MLPHQSPGRPRQPAGADPDAERDHPERRLFGERPIAYPFKTTLHPDTGDPFDGIIAGAVWLRAKTAAA